jgi:hypothetical protein
VCAFSGGQARSSVLGVRPSASIRYRVSGPRYRVPVFEKPAHGVCKVARCRVGVTKGETDGRTVVLPFGLGMKSLRSYIWTWVVGLWGP